MANASPRSASKKPRSVSTARHSAKLGVTQRGELLALGSKS
jgi:hypothetical protein